MKPSQTDIARRKILEMSKAISVCSEQAAQYAKCVGVRSSIQQHECGKEFEALARCMKKAAKKS